MCAKFYQIIRTPGKLNWSLLEVQNNKAYGNLIMCLRLMKTYTQEESTSNANLKKWCDLLKVTWNAGPFS